jgi:hypothetical protein
MEPLKRQNRARDCVRVTRPFGYVPLWDALRRAHNVARAIRRLDSTRSKLRFASGLAAPRLRRRVR